jgi:hypothetical protein
MALEEVGCQNLDQIRLVSIGFLGGYGFLSRLKHMGRDDKRCDCDHYTTVHLHANYIQAPLDKYSRHITAKRGSPVPNVGMQAYDASNILLVHMKLKVNEYGEKLELYRHKNIKF